jgi:GT2 family glycosyltransferase
MLSVVIPIFNNHDYSYECIMAVMENTNDYELVIIDNGSEPPFKPPFTGFVECQLIRNETNKGFPHAINQGIAAAKGDTICLLNNDVIVTPGYAERLAGYLDEYAIVGPCANYSAGLQRVTAGIYNSKDELHREAEAWSDDWNGMIEDVTFVIGFCMMFKKSLFDEIGQFDESLWPCSGEEIDFCLRAHEAGHKIGIARDVYVHHEGSMTLDEMDKTGVIEYQELCKRNDAHLAVKWGADFWMKQAVAQ